jgi:hypothetical protein
MIAESPNPTKKPRRGTLRAPTTRDVFLQSSVNADQDDLEREFFARIVLPNGTIKSTGAHRMDDLNAAVLPHIAAITGMPVRVLDVAVSSGVSTAEWYESLAAAKISCDFTATDLTVYASLVSLTPGLAVLVDRHRNILHLDVFGRGVPPVAEGPGAILAGAIRMLFRAAMKLDDRLSPLNGSLQEFAKGHVLKCQPVTLLTKRLSRNEHLRVIEQDLMAPDPPQFQAAFHVVRAANILNRSYFSDQILAQIVNKLKKTIKPHGLFIVCRTEHNGVNDATLFQFAGDLKFRVLLRLGAGSEIENLVLGI